MASKNFNYDVNLYDLLGVDPEAEQAEIRKAYRKKALECHPDKNPDNPKAAELFHELSKALELLTDIKARAAYDKVLKAKKAAELRALQQSSKRQKLKAELEKRERDAQPKNDEYSQYKKYSDDMETHIDRLRDEGSKLLEEEQRLMREQLMRNLTEFKLNKEKSTPTFDSSQHRIKIKWKADKHDATNGGYSEAKLTNYLKKYGNVVGLVMSKKNGNAMVELGSLEACEMVLAYEKGDMVNPLQLEWVTAPQNAKAATTSVSGIVNDGGGGDFEDLVMRKLRQAEERKRLIEQMQKEDEETES